jgi:trehalose 6-phosphate phosphatase
MNRFRPKRLWFFDFDGTLSPIVPERSQAVIHPDCKNLLEELVATPHERVAVLSSRLLDDLIPRVGVAGVFLGGGSGVEWIVDGKERWIADNDLKDRLKSAREKLIPHITKMSNIPGIDIEDKKWSFAIHTRNSSFTSKRRIALLVKKVITSLNIRMFRGPEVIEIPLLPEIDKSFGVQALCKFLDFNPFNGDIVYAGDDENDATAMDWVLQRGGIAFTVGHAPLVPGARVVEDPEALAGAIRQLIDREREKRIEVKLCTSLR